MRNCFTILYDYVTEHTPSLRNDPQYYQALQAYMEVEAEVKEKIGDGRLYKYQCAEADVSHQHNVAVFIQTLRFTHKFMLEILGG